MDGRFLQKVAKVAKKGRNHRWTLMGREWEGPQISQINADFFGVPAGWL